MAIGVGAVGLAIAFFTFMYVKKQSPGSSEMAELGDAIHDGAMAFLKADPCVVMWYPCEYRRPRLSTLLVNQNLLP